jgi:hypothetical protein
MTKTKKAETTSDPATDAVASSPPVAAAKASDGFDSVDDGGGRSIIKGTKIKYAKTEEWVDEAGEVIDPAREFIVIQLDRVEQKWIDNLPVETRVLAPNEYFRDLEKLNAEAPKSEWRDAFGHKEGPWQKSYACYMLDPNSLQAFTWPTSTIGGFRAIEDLKNHVGRARMAQGANVFPVVTLSDIHMNTAFGGRQRPAFKVVRFIALGGTERPLLEEPKPEPMNDRVPY